MGCPAVCDCGISWLYTLTFCSYITQFLRSRRLFNMAIYQPFVMLLVMSQPGFLWDSIHFRVLILSGLWSGNGKISCWQAFNNSRDSIQEALCYLRPGSLKSSVTDALEKYVCILYQPDADIVWLTVWSWWMFWRKKLNCVTYHLQALRFSKVSKVRIINSSFWNPHLALILTNQCLTIMVGSGTVIDVFHNDDIASWSWSPSAADKLWLQHVCMRNISVLLQSLPFILYRFMLRTHVKYCQWAMTFELLFSYGFRHFFNHINKKALQSQFWPLKDQILDDPTIVACKR